MECYENTAYRRACGSASKKARWLALLALAGGLGFGVPATAAEPPTGEEKDAATGKTVPPLTQQRFYEILLADIALQRREPVLASRMFLKLAEETRASWFAQRAAESAIMARDRTLLEQSLATWQKFDPASERPRQIRTQVARLLLDPASRDRNDAETLLQLEGMLLEAQSDDALGDAFMQLNQVFARRPDKRNVFNLIKALALPYPNQPEAHYAVALAAVIASAEKGADKASLKPILEEGSREIDKTLAAAPDWEDAVRVKAALLEQTTPEQLVPWLEKRVADQPGQKTLWPLLARAYAQRKEYGKAREWFLKVWKDNGSDDALMAAAALSTQMQDRQEAEALLDEVRKTQGDDKANALLIIYARIAEDEKRPMEAIDWYRRVDEGDEWWGVQLRLAQLLAQNGKRDDALSLLADLPAVTLEERLGVLQVQSAILRSADELPKAKALLEQGLKDFPNSGELFLELALVEEKLGQLKDAEAHLREALKLKPKDPYVQNALGYTLVDRELNIEEGAALIKEALAAMPDDAAILDSMGWAYYRQGNLDEALGFLQKAMKKQPDAEVAAHLGEVLWRLERRNEARGVWNDGLQLTPKDALIRKTMQRLGAETPSDR